MHILKRTLFTVLILLSVSILSIQTVEAADPCDACSGSDCTAIKCSELDLPPSIICYFEPGMFPASNSCTLNTVACADACGYFESVSSCESDCAAIPLCNFDGLTGTCAIGGPSNASPITGASDAHYDSEIKVNETEPLVYKLLVPSVPGKNVDPNDADLCSYLGGMFLLLIVVCAVLAVLVIVIGGVQLVMGAASPSARSDAKDRILNAIIGILIALVSWLVLNSINPLILGGCTALIQL